MGDRDQDEVGQTGVENTFGCDPDLPQALGLEILPINIAHVMTVADPEPQTRDPFDRLLIAECQVEGMKLVTVDRAVVGHPMAFRQ